MLGAFPGLDVHWGLGFGLVACVVAWVLMQRTIFGFAARMVGGNARAALLDGLPVRRLIVIATLHRRVPAPGVAGAVEVAAVHGTANASLVAGYGYTGVLVAFIARSNPLAVIPVALLLGGIGASGGLIQRVFELPDATVNVLQGILFIVHPVLGDAARRAAGKSAARCVDPGDRGGRMSAIGGVALARAGRRGPGQHAVPVRQPGRVPDREERAREPGPRGDAGDGGDVGLRRLVPDRLALAGRAGGGRWSA